MAEVKGLSKLVRQLTAKTQAPANVKPRKVTVGYGAPYATRVHEDLEMVHPRGGQAKFLETPTRKYKSVMADIVAKAMKEGKTVEEAEVLAANFLLKESQKLVPVRTGRLRDSGFVRVG